MVDIPCTFRMRGGAKKRGQNREAANHDDNDETAPTEQRRRDDETFDEEQGGGDSSEFDVEGIEATPSAGSSEKRAPTMFLIDKILICRKLWSGPARQRCEAASSGE